jgi:hypothetical protein
MTPAIQHGIDNLLAVELEHDAQDAMRSGMLRSEIEKHEVHILTLPFHAPFLGMKLQGFLFLLFFVGRQSEWLHVRRAGGMVFPKWVTFPSGRHQDPSQVWMTVNADAKHVPDFALVPVRRRPNVGDGRKRGRFAFERHLDAHIFVSLVGEQMIDDSKIALWLPVPVGADAFVDRGKIIQHSIGLLGF